MSAMMLNFTDASTLHALPRSLFPNDTTFIYRFMAFYVRNNSKLHQLIRPIARYRMATKRSTHLTHMVPTHLRHVSLSSLQ